MDWPLKRFREYVGDIKTDFYFHPPYPKNPKHKRPLDDLMWMVVIINGKEYPIHGLGWAGKDDEKIAIFVTINPNAVILD